MMDAEKAVWAEHFERERGRYADGEARLSGLREPDGHSHVLDWFYQESQTPLADDSALARDGRPPEEVKNQIF